MDVLNREQEFIISFCIIAYNEENHIQRLLDNLLVQTYPRRLTEVVLVDSCSSDRTKEIMESFRTEYLNEYKDIIVCSNPGKILPCGWNTALGKYTGQAIVRVDAHAEISPDFIEKNVIHLKEGDAVCGGYRPNIIDEDTPWKRTLLAAESSMFGSSVADFRRNGEDRKVKSVFHGAYQRKVFDKVGGFNESLVRTEDNDMNYRIREAGFDIWFHPDILSYQHTRESLGKMVRQKYLNGYWIGRTLGVTPGCISLYYLVPLAFVLAVIFTTVLALAGYPMLAKVMWGMYGIFALFSTVTALIHDENRSVLYIFLPILFFLLHISYGTGTFFGILRMFMLKFMHRSKTV